MAKKQSNEKEEYLTIGITFISIGIVFTVVTGGSMRYVGLPFLVIGVVFVSQASGWLKKPKKKK